MSGAPLDDDDLVRVVVSRVRESADLQVLSDLCRLRARGVHGFGDQVKRMASSTRRGSGSRPDLLGPRHYDPSVRVIWDWYVEVATAVVDRRFGFSSEKLPDAAAVEAAARRIAAVRSYPHPRGPVIVAAVAWRMARESAERFVLDAYRSTKAEAIDRGATEVDHHVGRADGSDRELSGRVTSGPDVSGAAVESAGRDTRARWGSGAEAQLDSAGAKAILRHWYQRCYDAALDAQLGLLQPLCAVTEGEAAEVAASIRRGEFRRLIGADGVPLVTAHGTAVTSQDRQLAAGEVGVVPPPARRSSLATNRTLRQRVVHDWNRADPGVRVQWVGFARAGEGLLEQRWAAIPGADQSKLIGHWLDAHRGPYRVSQEVLPAPPTFRPEMVPGPPGVPVESAAAAMFNHTPHPNRPHPGRDKRTGRDVGAVTLSDLKQTLDPANATARDIQARDSRARDDQTHNDQTQLERGVQHGASSSSAVVKRHRRQQQHLVENTPRAIEL